MTGMASLSGGAHHGLAALTHAEREAARNALAKLKGGGSVLGHLDGSMRSATVYSGAAMKTAGLNASTALQGHGQDTFIGGARSGFALADGGNDTVVSGSAATFGGRTSDVINPHGGQHFSLSTDTISVAGVTAESVKAGHTDVTASHSHTITLADKTTVTITGVSSHDIGKLTH